jgi:hypothetical protein
MFYKTKFKKSFDFEICSSVDNPIARMHMKAVYIEKKDYVRYRRGRCCDARGEKYT